MTDCIAGYLEVGTNGRGEVVVNHPDLKPDAAGVGHIVFSPRQARGLAALLLRHAERAETGAGGGAGRVEGKKKERKKKP